MDNSTPDGIEPGESPSHSQESVTAPEQPPELPRAEPLRAEPQAGMAQHIDVSVRRRPGMLTYALAGLHAGFVGVIWMFACLIVAAFWNGGIWSVPNLFATVLYGDSAYQDEFLRSTWAGLALIVVLYGLMGAIWGCFWKEDRKPLLSFFGALTGLAVYFLFFDLIWVHLDPLIPLYAPVRQLQVAHILWGAALARSPGYSKRIIAATTQPETFRSTDEDGFPPPPKSNAGPAADHDEAESVSGELIQ